MKLVHRLEDDVEGNKRTQQESESAQVEQIEQKSTPGQPETGWKRRLNALKEFWAKVNNDWVFNLSGLLAYNLLMSIFPILLVLIAVAGFVLNFISPGSQQHLTDAIAGLFPNGTAGQQSTGHTIVTAALHSLTQSAGLVLAIGLLTAAFGGSRLFITIESCFSIIFRLRPRDALHQNIMAFLMLLLYIVLIPIIFLASSVANTVARILFPAGTNVVTGLLIRGAGVLIALVVALVLFAAIYIVVPNRPVHIKEVWRGTLTGAALLILYELVFPIYQSLFLKPNNYGSLAGFAIVILVFFYYFAFILLLGAEVNSWASGQRATASDISGIIHEVQAHDTTRGAAGPTAGTPTEDLQNHEGKAAMLTNTQAIYHERVQHKDDEKPPKFAEANSPNPAKTAREAERTTGYDTNRPQHRPEPGKHGGEQLRAGSAETAGNDDQSRMSDADGDRRHSKRHTQDRTQPERQQGRIAAMSANNDHDGRGRGRQIGPNHPEYAAPLPPEARDLPHSGPQQPRNNGSAGMIAILATAALPVLMWFLGRNQRHA